MIANPEPMQLGGVFNGVPQGVDQFHTPIQRTEAQVPTVCAQQQEKLQQCEARAPQ